MAGCHPLPSAARRANGPSRLRRCRIPAHPCRGQSRRLHHRALENSLVLDGQVFTAGTPEVFCASMPRTLPPAGRQEPGGQQIRKACGRRRPAMVSGSTVGLITGCFSSPAWRVSFPSASWSASSCSLFSCPSFSSVYGVRLSMPGRLPAHGILASGCGVGKPQKSQASNRSAVGGDGSGRR